jgi:arylsulfatase A-like enzyme
LNASTLVSGTGQIGVSTAAGPQRVSRKLVLHPGLALLSIVALFSLSLEVELLQQIDSMRLYLTGREIALEAGVALLFSMLLAGCWWLLILVLGWIAETVLRIKRFRVPLYWNPWIAVPLAYLTLDLFEDFKLAFRPQWHAGANGQALVTLALLCICVVVFYGVGWPVLQKLCRTRLVPIAWLHIVLATVAAIALLHLHVRPFRDYEHPRQAIATSSFPDIYLITIDALRADDMSVYGYDRTTTPNLEKFAQRSFTFDNNFANSNFTTPATTSIETGKLPWSHRVFHMGGFLRGENQQENLATLLRERGYYTAMITSNLLAAPFRHRTLGSYDAVQYAAPLGIDGIRSRVLNLIGTNAHYTLGFCLVRGVTALSSYLDHLFWGDRYPSPAEEVFSRSARLLERSNSPQPVFLWSHILPPHDPYWVPPRYRNRFVSQSVRHYDKFVLPDPVKPRSGVAVPQLRSAYDEMILYADHAVGEYLDWLDRTGRLDRSIVIVSADHGELFDHGRLWHAGPELYNGVIHIPLLIHLPGQKEGERVEQISQQADLLPTLLDLIGAPAPDWTEGISLKPLLNEKAVPDRYVFSMNLQPNGIFNPLSKGTVAAMNGDFKFIRYLASGREELFNYKIDHGEEHNLVGSEPDVANRMRKVLLDKVQEINQKPIDIQ